MITYFKSLAALCAAAAVCFGLTQAGRVEYALRGAGAVLVSSSGKRSPCLCLPAAANLRL